jgi:two-component system chemotaxis response regulator CheB
MFRHNRTYRAIAAGVSMGGVEALRVLLGGLPADFPLPLLIVHHISPDSGSDMASFHDSCCALRVKEADEEEAIIPGTAYLAPANYHLLVERDGHLMLSTDLPVNFARPSIDVLFESAAYAFGSALIGIVLTGGGTDGSKGLKTIQDHGGLVIVQDPEDAEMEFMPRHALAAVKADYVLPLREISPLLCRLTGTDYRGKTNA